MANSHSFDCQTHDNSRNLPILPKQMRWMEKEYAEITQLAIGLKGSALVQLETTTTLTTNLVSKNISHKLRNRSFILNWFAFTILFIWLSRNNRDVNDITCVVLI